MKKDEARFTVRFCLTDPRHRKVVEALNAAGRRKASLIVEAVCDYLVRYGADGEFAAPAPIRNSVEPVQEPVPTKDVAVDDELRQAVLSGLSMFNV